MGCRSYRVLLFSYIYEGKQICRLLSLNVHSLPKLGDHTEKDIAKRKDICKHPRQKNALKTIKNTCHGQRDFESTNRTSAGATLQRTQAYNSLPSE